jgi:hypothetical protein
MALRTEGKGEGGIGDAEEKKADMVDGSWTGQGVDVILTRC